MITKEQNNLIIQMVKTLSILAWNRDEAAFKVESLEFGKYLDTLGSPIDDNS